MNFDGFDFDDNIKQTFNTLDIQGRVPHAVVIESRDSEKAMNLAVFLSLLSITTASGNSAPNIEGVEGLFYIVVKIKTVKIQNPTSAYLSHLIISFYFCNFHNYFKATVLVTISPLVGDVDNA